MVLWLFVEMLSIFGLICYQCVECYIDVEQYRKNSWQMIIS